MGPLMGTLGSAAMSRLTAMPGNLGKAATAAQKLGNNLMAAKDFAMTLAKEIDQTAKEMIHLADSMGGRWVQIEDIAFKTARTMAMSRKQAKEYTQELLSATRDLAAQYGISAREMANFQKTYAEAVGRNIVLTRDQMAHMAALAKVTDNATASQLVENFDKLGIGIEMATANIGLMQERAKALGINATKATKIIKDNLRLATTYSFRNGVKDIEAMSLKAASLKMDMSAIAGSLDKFRTLEGAITNSAEIQLLGGSIGAAFNNPLSVMYQATSDPKGFMDNIVKSIAGKGTYNEKTGEVTFDPITMYMMREYAERLGMSAEQLNTAAMAVTQNEKVGQELRRNANYAQFSKKDRVAIENLARTNFDEKTGKHYISYLKNGTVHTRNVEELTTEELEIAKDNQLTQEKLWGDVHDIADLLHSVHGRARGTQSTREREKGLENWWDSLVAWGQNLYMRLVSNTYATATDATGSKHFSTGGIATPLHAADGMIVPGDSYVGDKIPAMLNSGEMVLNPMQQKSMFNMIQSLAMSGGMVYGMNRLGGKMGVGGLGSTMILANALGGEDTGIREIIEAHYIKKAIKKLSPFKKSVESIGEAAKETSQSTSTVVKSLGKVGKSVNKFSEWFYSPFDKLGKKLRSTKLAKSVANYYDTVKNTTFDEARKRSKYYKGGKAVSQESIKGGKFTRSLIKGKSYLSNFFNEKTDVEKAKPKVTKKTPKVAKAKTLDIGTGKKVQEPKITTKQAKAKILDISTGKEVKGKKASAAKATKTATKATKSATTAAKTISKASKALGTMGKVAKVGGRLLGPIGTVLQVGSSVMEGFDAKSKYDKQLAEINRANMSDKQKAIAKDKIEKERNKSYGGAAGSAVGAMAGAALGTLLGPLGMAAGGWLGSMAGEWIGKGIGGLFGGNNAKKYEKPVAHAKDGLIVPGNSYTGDKVPIRANSGEMILDQNKQKNLFSMLSNPISGAVKALPDLSSFMKVLPFTGLASSAVKTIGIGKTDINLHVSGTIKLEGGNKSAEIDIAKLIETPEFKRKLTDMLTKSLNENSNAGKRNMESERNNMAKQYNRTGS